MVDVGASARPVPSFGALAASFVFASLIIGLSFGLAATAAGVTPATVLVMSTLVFGGGAQFAALGVILAGGPPLTAVLVGLALNARFLLFGVVVGARLRTPFLRRLLMAFIAIDASLLIATLREEPRRSEHDFWRMGLLTYGAWQLGTLAGLGAGTVLIDADALGLDALITVTFVGLLAPLVTDRRSLAAVIVGGAVALLVNPLVPPGVPVLLAAVLAAAIAPAIAAGPLPVPRWSSRRARRGDAESRGPGWT